MQRLDEAASRGAGVVSQNADPNSRYANGQEAGSLEITTTTAPTTILAATISPAA